MLGRIAAEMMNPAKRSAIDEPQLPEREREHDDADDHERRDECLAGGFGHPASLSPLRSRQQTEATVGANYPGQPCAKERAA